MHTTTVFIALAAIAAAFGLGLWLGWYLRRKRDRAVIAQGADLVAQLISVNQALEAQNTALDKLLVDTLSRWASGSRRGGQ